MNDGHGSPEAVFATAQEALGAGNLAGAFACFDRADLAKIANNSVRALSSIDPHLDELGNHFGFDAASLSDMRELTDQIAASAALLSNAPASFDSATHQKMVKNYEVAVKNGLQSVADMPGFAAALEDRMRTCMGGGSISTSLFDGESLTAIVIDGNKAWATRVHGGQEIDDVGFVQKRDGWKIKLFARRPQR